MSSTRSYSVKGYDFAAAAGLFNAVVAFILVMTANTLSKRYSRTSLW